MTQVRPGAEAWAADGGDVGVLLLHGFTGSPAALRPLAETLAGQGCAVELPRLPGHGTRWQDLGRTTWRDWVREAIAAHERLVARTRARVAVGLSFGGCLALYLAETHGDELSGLVLINPAVNHRHPLMPLMPALKRALPFVPGVANDIAKPGQDEVGYDKVSLRAFGQYVDCQRLVRADLGRVHLPTLVFTSRQDHVISPEDSALVVEGIASDDVTQVWLERCYHVATLDHEAPEIERDTAAFVKRVTA
jgi:carboxylesterase